jgi:diguanylate cyclase (GGDEF)-like protein
MKALVVDDDSVSALVLRKTLEHLGHEAIVASDGWEAARLYDQSAFPVVISDWMMPRMDGLDLCRHIRASALDSYTYVILLTAKTQRNDRLEALQAGVDDFLTKPLDRAELAARITVAGRIVSWDLQLRELNDSLLKSKEAMVGQALELERMRCEAEYLATHDGLTGLLSRRAWFDLALSSRPAALAMFDIDNFKIINDRFGHPAGDAALKAVAKAMLGALPPCGMACRYGGEEFAALVPGLDETELREFAERLRHAIETSVPDPAHRERKVTASVGFALARPGETGRGALDRADAAGYRAKANGRNRVEGAQ